MNKQLWVLVLALSIETAFAQTPVPTKSPIPTAIPATTEHASTKSEHVSTMSPPSATTPSAQPMTQPISSGLHVTVYPAKGQTAEAQGADELQCYNWAKNQTGIDPQTQQAKVDSQTTQAPQQAQTKGTRAKGAVGGAAAGALIGEIASDDAGNGAAIGATTGVLAGGARARREERADQEAQTKAKEEQEKAQAAQAESLNTFKKAFGTCLQGRGYTTAH